MTDSEHSATKPDEVSSQKTAAPRKPRSIRFSDSEWAGIEKQAQAQGMRAAELVRHAAVSVVAGNRAQNSPAFPPEIVAQIERIYRGVYFLATLRREEMFHEGRQEEYERIRKSSQDSEAAILNEASKPSV